MKELDSFTVYRLEELIKSASLEPCDAEPIYDNVQVREIVALARIALAAKRAEPDYHIVRRLFADGYGTHVELDVYIEKLDASKSKDDHGGEIIPAYTTPQLNSPEIPEGWKLTPINPTEEMVTRAWREAIGRIDHGTIRRIYLEMLAAAPEKPL